jgi:HAMP domain-containing protein
MVGEAVHGSHRQPDLGGEGHHLRQTPCKTARSSRCWTGLHPVVIEAPDEVGALARAFNDMFGELQRSFETLEQPGAGAHGRVCASRSATCAR